MLRLIQLPGEPLAGRHAVIVAKWPPFAESLAKALQNLNVEVEWIKPNTLNLAERTRTGHILLTAAGKANLITGDMVKPGAIVIDMGTNHVAGKLVGDVDYNSVATVAGWLTPVPGGVGPMTVAMLLWRAYQLACQRHDLPVPEIPQITLADLTVTGSGSPLPAR
jgi:methylenetetrahydrofolate dehydrogenase (NADP+)/methenyltetrahydrofolate cyclohydrolase